jgi:multiple antibiotic resistance protein
MATGVQEIARESLLILGGLFPIVNPLGTAPIFLTLTRDVSSRTRALLARKIAVNGFILLLASIFIGTYILEFFGISLPVVQVGGGMVVLATGWKLLHLEREVTLTSARATPAEVADRAFYPLTLPLTVGPGTISVAITIGANKPLAGVAKATVLSGEIIGAGLIALSIYLSYRFAERIARALGRTVMNVILRLMSFILLCIGVQILWNGVKALLATGRAL